MLKQLTLACTFLLPRANIPKRRLLEVLQHRFSALELHVLPKDCDKCIPYDIHRCPTFSSKLQTQHLQLATSESENKFRCYKFCLIKTQNILT